MAKTMKKIAAKRATMAGLRQAVQEYRDGYEAARSDVEALQKRNAELLEMRDEAKHNAASWLARCNDQSIKINNLERDNKGLEGKCERLQERLHIADDNFHRLMGWVDAKMGRSPQIETEIPF